MSWSDPDYHFKWRQRNKDKVHRYAKNSRLKIKLAAFDAYGGPICNCCGETTVEFLTIDHINGNGKSHRQTFDGPIYRILKKEEYPEGYQVLCMNCNFALGVHGHCPHQPLVDGLALTINSGG